MKRLNHRQQAPKWKRLNLSLKNKARMLLQKESRNKKVSRFKKKPPFLLGLFIEISETAAIQNIDKFMVLVMTLKAKGFSFSLDDFGSGLSSFTYLKNMPVDFLKIDGSFVKEIATDKTAYAMVKSIHEVGRVMGLETIAEFVEDEAILDKLREIGVTYAQGYHIHIPQPLDEIHSEIAVEQVV
ncbi:MAG: EAL domain-containing protein [Cycloclasticus sp.]